MGKNKEPLGENFILLEIEPYQLTRAKRSAHPAFPCCRRRYGVFLVVIKKPGHQDVATSVMVGTEYPWPLPVVFGISGCRRTHPTGHSRPSPLRVGALSSSMRPQGIVQRGGAHHALEGHGGFTHTLLAPGAANVSVVEWISALAPIMAGSVSSAAFFIGTNMMAEARHNGADHRDQDPGSAFPVPF